MSILGIIVGSNWVEAFRLNLKESCLYIQEFIYTTTILKVLGFLDAEHILMHFKKFVKFHAGEGRKITTLCTFESFSISNFRSRNSSQKGTISC
jgi:hypothetical protein